jgi:hypothetical protein
MTCDETKILLAEYWSQSLGEAQELAFEAHLAICDPCRADSEQLGAIWKNLALIPESSKDFEPSSAVRSRFYETLGAFRQGLESAPKRSIGDRLLAMWPKQPAYQVAASFAMLAIGLGLGYEIKQSPVTPAQIQPGPEVAQLRDEVSSMKQMVALSLLQQQNAGERMRGVSYAYMAQPNDTQVLTALLTTVNNDESTSVRLSAVDALHAFGGSPVMRAAVIQSIRKQQNSLVQVALIDLLVDLKEKEAVPELQALSVDSKINAAVRQHAQQAIGKLK